MALNKHRLYLGRTEGGRKQERVSKDNAWILLELVDQWWHIDDLRCPGGLKVNGRPCKRERLMPSDEIEFGKYRFRIGFEEPKYEPGKGRSVVAKRRGSKASRARSAASMGVLGRLVPMAGGGTFQITRSPVTLGREASCDITIPGGTVSGKHCRLSLINGYWRASDLGSRNGIRVDSRRCREEWVLPGHRLSLAEHRFKLEYEGVGPPPIVDDELMNEISKSLTERAGLSESELDRIARASEHDDPRPERFDLNTTDEAGQW